MIDDKIITKLVIKLLMIGNIFPLHTGASISLLIQLLKKLLSMI